MLLEKKEKAQPFFGLTYTDTESRIEVAKSLLKKTKEGYPNASVCVSTMRDVISVNKHVFGAVALENGEYSVFEPKAMPVYDRIGGGDAFVGGFLYSTIKEWDMEKKLAFGWCCSAFVSGLADDYGLPTSEKQIWNLQAEDAWTSR